MSKGRFGDFGGQYIPETLMNEIINLEESYEKYSKDPEFIKELDTLLREYARQTVTALLRRKDDEGPRRRKDISQARGSESYRIAQDK